LRDERLILRSLLRGLLIKYLWLRKALDRHQHITVFIPRPLMLDAGKIPRNSTSGAWPQAVVFARHQRTAKFEDILPSDYEKALQ